MIRFLSRDAISALPSQPACRAMIAALLLAALPMAARAATSAVSPVEQRIASLHGALKITPDEEAVWAQVAQAMRDNAAGVEKLNAEHGHDVPEKITALQHMKIYEEYARQHLQGLEVLDGAFEKLYTMMPPAQQAVADKGFLASRRPPGRGNTNR